MLKHYFTVKGIGPFPFDMLRYDCCYPRYNSYDLIGDQERQVALVATHPKQWHPTSGRWESFGWYVTEHTVE